jgi:hypothetical protein
MPRLHPAKGTKSEQAARKALADLEAEKATVSPSGAQLANDTMIAVECFYELLSRYDELDARWWALHCAVRDALYSTPDKREAILQAAWEDDWTRWKAAMAKRDATRKEKPNDSE